MEEKKNQAQEPERKKLSYEELSKAASELHIQYQKLVVEYKKAVEALNNREFEYNSFFLTMLFKVMEHPERYTEKFVKWSSENIEAALTGFAEAARLANKEQEEKKDEAK